MRTLRSFAVVALCLWPALAAAQAKGKGSGKKDTQASEADIYKLLDATGSYKIAEQVMAQMSQSLGASTKIPPAFWEEMQKKVNKKEFYDMVVPIYRKHLSPGDVKALLGFYQTPAGQRVVKSMPVIAQESVAAGQIWGQSIAKQVIEEMKKRGYDKDAPAAAAPSPAAAPAAPPPAEKK